MADMPSSRILVLDDLYAHIHWLASLLVRIVTGSFDAARGQDG